jgi:hypothetical protein
VHNPNGFTLGTNKRMGDIAYTLATSISAERLKNYAINDAIEEKGAMPCDFSINKDGSLLVQMPE